MSALLDGGGEGKSTVASRQSSEKHREVHMKNVLYIIAGILILAGGVFFLQGMSVLPSRLMYGRPEWVIIGAVVVVGGIALGVIARRR